MFKSPLFNETVVSFKTDLLVLVQNRLLARYSHLTFLK